MTNNIFIIPPNYANTVGKSIYDLDNLVSF